MPKRKLKTLIKETFEMSFPTFIDLHFRSETRYQAREKIIALFKDKGLIVDFSASTLYKSVVEEYNNLRFRFEVSNRGRKPGFTKTLNDGYDVVYQCKKCKKAWRDRNYDFDSQSMHLKLANFKCPACGEVKTTIATITETRTGKTGVKDIIPIYIPEIDKTYEMECFVVDSKEVNNPFKKEREEVLV
jgi:Zn finger protein HypA/HybF involved in hydrogenase expression